MCHDAHDESSRADIFLGGRRFFVLFFRINFFVNPRQNYFLRTIPHKCLLVLKQARGTCTQRIVKIAFFLTFRQVTSVTFCFLLLL